MPGQMSFSRWALRLIIFVMATAGLLGVGIGLATGEWERAGVLLWGAAFLLPVVIGAVALETWLQATGRGPANERADQE